MTIAITPIPITIQQPTTLQCAFGWIEDLHVNAKQPPLTGAPSGSMTVRPYANADPTDADAATRVFAPDSAVEHLTASDIYALIANLTAAGFASAADTFAAISRLMPDWRAYKAARLADVATATTALATAKTASYAAETALAAAKTANDAAQAIAKAQGATDAQKATAVTTLATLTAAQSTATAADAAATTAQTNLSTATAAWQDAAKPPLVIT